MSTKIEKLTDLRFLRVFDIQYAEGRHYYNATRRTQEELVVTKDDEAFRAMIPDAVSCCVILDNPGEEPRLLLANEWRYPIGRFVLGVPAGLIDPEDRGLPREEAVYATARRELKEETGLIFSENDSISMINPCLFSTPGMTDECNAMVKMVLRGHDPATLDQSGCEGTELFNGFALLTKEDAKRLMRQGCDDAGVFYSVYTWIALAAFVADL